jgi:organic hydroperoxide reductase OsmC/OhrA
MAHSLEYLAQLDWTGNTGGGTVRYDGYGRDFRLSIDGKPGVHGSADPAFRGDAARLNPEDLFLGAIESCHLLSYLALCARRGVNVLAYADRAEGRMETTASGGRFVEVVLHPRVVVSAESDAQLALRLHQAAHASCFIANSCSVPIRCEPQATIAGGTGASP